MLHLKIYDKQDILSLTRIRRFETKLGEIVQALGNPQNIEEALEQSSAKFVIAGIPEGIGVKANLGVGGACNRYGGARTCEPAGAHTSETTAAPRDHRHTSVQIDTHSFRSRRAGRVGPDPC